MATSGTKRKLKTEGTAGTSSGKESSTCSWDVTQVLSDQLDCAYWAVNNTVELLDADNSIPFISRYRKEQTNNMSVETLRELQAKYEDLKTVQNKVTNVIKAVEKLDKMTEPLKTSLQAAQNMMEVEHLYAPYKPGSKKTLAERARDRGLEPMALNILKQPNKSLDLQAVSQGQTLAEVQQDVQYIISDIFAKDKDAMDYVRSLCKYSNITLESVKSKTREKKTTDSTKGKPSTNKAADPEKFKLYFNFCESIKRVRPHQVMAINRGEHLKVLSVKINIPDDVRRKFDGFCERKWIPATSHKTVQSLLLDCAKDAYSRLVHPLLLRHFRSGLTKDAEKASVEVFASNLKRLLMTPPVRGKVVMGIDPGFRNGCKYAVTSVISGVLETGVLYLHSSGRNNFREADRLRQSLLKHRCETVAIGNGTACRETETFLAKHIQQKTFSPLDVSYCIVSEAGASIYSASDEAIKELPDMDVSLRGAVSIARRLQDPLAELVKIEPKHIGVGMYQHDVSDNLLKTALGGVVEDCVSFVGVDLNTCSEILLRKIAGLNSTRAKNIVAWREAHGSFINREQLQDIKGLGPKTYQQCAGFVRIVPETRGSAAAIVKQEATEESAVPSGGRKRKLTTAKTTKSKTTSKKSKLSSQPNSLDMTSIHPESYHIAERLLGRFGVSPENVGQETTLQTFKRFRRHEIEDLAKEMDVGVPTMTLIIEALQQPVGYDIRNEFEKPLFKQGLTSIEDLKSGSVLTGRVENCTHFGAFVDIGVGRSGLIHTSNMRPAVMNGRKQLELGDRVEVVVISVDLSSQRISLRLNQLL